MVRRSSQWFARSRQCFVGRFVGEFSLLLLNTDMEDTRSQIERLGATGQRSGISDTADSADTTDLFAGLQNSSASMVFACPIRKQSSDTCDTADSADTANPRNRAWFSVAIDRKQGGRSPRSDR